MALSSKEVDIGPQRQENYRDYLLSRVQNVREREPGILEGYVNFSDIDFEDIPIDDKNVQRIRNSMQKIEAGGKKSGQMSALLLGLIEGKKYFSILDGIHRGNVMRGLNKTGALCTILSNCTEEDALDIRIVSAAIHKTVSFARTVEWSKQAWELTSWAKKLKLTEAFSLRFEKRRARVGVDMREADEIKKWIDDKCVKWGIVAPTLHQYLLTAEIADPELVKSVRFSTGGSGGLKALTVNHLSKIARALPGNFEFQNIVAKEVLRDELRVPKTVELSEAVSKAKTAEEAIEIAENGPWKEENRPRRSRRNIQKTEEIQEKAEEKQEGGRMIDLEDQLFVAEDRVAKITINASGFREKAVSSLVEDEEILQAIKKATLILPSEYRTMFLLIRKYGLTTVDLAKIYKKTEQDVLKNFHNAQDIIRKSDFELVSVLKFNVDEKIIKQPKIVEEVVPLNNNTEKVKDKLSKDNHVEPKVIFEKPQIRKTVVLSKPSQAKSNLSSVNNHRNPGYLPLLAHKQAEQQLPSHPERKLEDFKEGVEIGRLKGEDSKACGKITGIVDVNGRSYIKISMFDRSTSSIPVDQFDNKYTFIKA